jgi:hypothetical protein
MGQPTLDRAELPASEIRSSEPMIYLRIAVTVKLQLGSYKMFCRPAIGSCGAFASSHGARIVFRHFNAAEQFTRSGCFAALLCC